MENLSAIIEAILFVSGDPVRVDILAHAMNLTVSELEEALSELRNFKGSDSAKGVFCFQSIGSADIVSGT